MSPFHNSHTKGKPFLCYNWSHGVMRLISSEIKSLKYSDSDKSSQNAFCEVSLSEL